MRGRRSAILACVERRKWRRVSTTTTRPAPWAPYIADGVRAGGGNRIGMTGWRPGPSKAVSTRREAATSSGWRYASCPLEIEPQRLGPFAALAETWRERRGPGRRLPARRDFDIEDFRPWLGRIFIARIERDPFDLRFTLWGTQLREWWRVDYTGKTLGALSADPALWQVERQYFQTMDREPFLGLASGLLSLHGREHINVLGLDLPLSDGDGLSHVLSTHMQIGLEETVESVLPNCPFIVFTDTGA